MIKGQGDIIGGRSKPPPSPSMRRTGARGGGFITRQQAARGDKKQVGGGFITRQQAARGDKKQVGGGFITQQQAARGDKKQVGDLLTPIDLSATIIKIKKCGN